jgi:TBC1 domain family member 20
LKQQLSDLIVSVLRAHPSLCYFQGYHDIAQVLLLVLGPDDSVEAVTRLSLLRIRDFMMSNLSSALTHLRLIPYILRAADPELAQHLPSQPFYALSTTLTLYAHDIQGYGEIARLFDFLLAREAVTSVYLFCEIIRMQRTELLEIEPQDTDMMHFTLSKLPNPLDIEALIASTMTLMKNYPPESLSFIAWYRVSGASTLKTTRDPIQVASQTLRQGEAWLAKQERQMKRQQKIDAAIKQARKVVWKYRSPALLSLAAVAIGVLSLWLGRGGGLDDIYRNLFADSIAGRRSIFGGVMTHIYRSLGGVIRD